MTSVALVRVPRLPRISAKSQQAVFFAQLTSSCCSTAGFCEQLTFYQFMEIFESATSFASVNTVLRQRPEACDFLIGRSPHLVSNGKSTSTEPQGKLHLREVSKILLRLCSSRFVLLNSMFHVKHWQSEVMFHVKHSRQNVPSMLRFLSN